MKNNSFIHFWDNRNHKTFVAPRIATYTEKPNQSKNSIILLSWNYNWNNTWLCFFLQHFSVQISDTIDICIVKRKNHSRTWHYSCAHWDSLMEFFSFPLKNSIPPPLSYLSIKTTENFGRNREDKTWCSRACDYHWIEPRELY